MTVECSNESRIKEVENYFGISGVPLLTENRELIGEGVLLKMCRKKAKPRHFFLFNDILVYGGIVIYKKKLMSQHILELEYISVNEEKGTEGYPFQFNIMSPKKSFIICASTAEERIQWVLHIKRYSKECRTGKEPRKSSVGEMCPIWVPDEIANLCMNCMITEFSWLQRRHHCRSCGNVVCDKCSQHRIILDNQSPRPLRVCVRCYLCHNIKSDSTDKLSLKNKEYDQPLSKQLC